VFIRVHPWLKKLRVVRGQKLLDTVWKWADSAANHGSHRDNSGQCRGAGCAGTAALAPATERTPAAPTRCGCRHVGSGFTNVCGFGGSAHPIGGVVVSGSPVAGQMPMKSGRK